MEFICRHFKPLCVSVDARLHKDNSENAPASSYRKGLHIHCACNRSTYFSSVMEHSLTDCPIQWVNCPNFIIIQAVRPHIHFLAKNLALIPVGLCQAIGYYWNRKGVPTPTLVPKWSIYIWRSWVLGSFAVPRFRLTKPRDCASRMWAPSSHIHLN